MKKFVVILLVIVLGICVFTGCSFLTEEEMKNAQKGESNPSDMIPDNVTSEDGKYQIALVLDAGLLKDGSFNEYTWNGIKQYASENNLYYKYYKPANGSDMTDEDRYDAILAAINNGAQIVVCPGYPHLNAIQKAATLYPNVNFVFVDGDLVKDEKGNPLKNVTTICFHEEESGYFAGYSIVKEGYRKLGFAGGGGGTIPSVLCYLYGFIQGANDAAKELGVNIEIRYTFKYGENFNPSPELQTLVNGWYMTGTEVVFACGGAIDQNIFAAAEADDTFTIGVDVDQAADSDTVLTSAIKNHFSEATMDICEKSYNGNWDSIGGKLVRLGAKDDATGLPTKQSSWRFKNFTIEEYNRIFEKVASGEVVVCSDYDNMYRTYSNVTLKED